MKSWKYLLIKLIRIQKNGKISAWNQSYIPRKYRKKYWLIGKNVINKILLYNLTLLWTIGSNKNNIKIIKIFQDKVLGNIVGAPRKCLGHPNI